MKPALHFPFAAANTPKVRFGNVSTQLSVPGSLTCSLSVIVKLGECSVALTALKELFAIVAFGGVELGSVELGGGDGGGLGGGGGLGAGLTPNDWTACGAFSYSESPAWSASSVQVPAPMKLTVEPEELPETVQTPGVAEERAGARREVAAAVTT